MMKAFQWFILALWIAAWPSEAPAQNQRPGRPTDLLKRLKLPDAGISGHWKKTADGLRSDSAAPARLRLGKPPEGGYDLVVTFTRLDGDGRLGLILSYDGNGFGWFLGEGRDKTASGFALVDGRGDWENNDALLENVVPDAKKHTLKIKVRKDGVTAFVDRKKKGGVTDYSSLTLDDENSVGEGMLGLVSGKPSIIFHSASVVPIAEVALAEKTPPVLKPESTQRGQEKADEANEVLPVDSVWYGTRIQLNHGGEIHCKMKVIERNGGGGVMRISEGSYGMRWTFSLRGDQLILEEFTQETGAGSISEVQASGVVSGGRMRIQYRWVFSGRRFARQIVVGTINLDQD